MNKVPICCGNLHTTYMACAVREMVAVSSSPSGASYCLYGDYWLIRRCAVPFYTFSDPPWREHHTDFMYRDGLNITLNLATSKTKIVISWVYFPSSELNWSNQYKRTVEDGELTWCHGSNHLRRSRNRYPFMYYVESDNIDLLWPKWIQRGMW